MNFLNIKIEALLRQSGKYQIVLIAIIGLLLNSELGRAQKRERTKKLPNYKSRGPIGATKTSAFNVTVQFKKGQSLFDKGKYNEATVIFNKILKRFPKHQPSIILYARSVYKLEKLDDAYYLFSRANTNLLDPNAAYEYGQTFYQKMQYGPAFVAFKRVPNNHAFGDLAKYYGGICALKLRRYDDAEAMMSKAVVLPEQEAKSRSLYLKHIGRLKQLKQRKSLAKERARERARLRRELAKLRSSTNSKISAFKGSKIIPEPTYGGFELVEKDILLGVEMRNSRLSYYGDAKRELAETRETYFHFKGGPLLYFNKNKQQNEYLGAYGVQIDIKGYEEYTKGQFVNDFRRDTVDQNLETDVDRNKSNNRIADAAIRPFVEWNIAPNYWFSISGEYQLLAPNFERKDRSTKQSGKLQAGYKTPITSAKAFFEMSQSHDAKAAPTLIDYNIGVDYSQTLWGDGGIFVDLDYFNYRYLDSKIDGADFEIITEVGIRQNLPLNFAFEMSAAYNSVVSYLAHNLPSYGDATADGQGFFAESSLLFKPTTWLYFEAAGNLSSKDWSVTPPDADEVFRKKVPEKESTTIFEAGLNLKF